MYRVIIILIATFLSWDINPALGVAHYRDDNTSLYTVKLPDSAVIDSIVVIKQSREMLVFNNGQLLKIYRVRLGTNPVGCKQVSGDCKTPEGLYCITYGNLNSLFHKSLGISYPNAQDIARAKKLGKSAGGDIMIHGLPNRDANVGPDRYTNDWTLGCIALRNEEIDEIFNRVTSGTPILITP
ncbi:MAG TPA: L,D-transpeptidase family protein [Chitinophagales bacterium]|nr:L,D-transpeptidase family protein [Chitinophagales bacterium]